MKTGFFKDKNWLVFQTQFPKLKHDRNFMPGTILPIMHYPTNKEAV